MQRLFDDRNRCAHPTYEQSGAATYRPSAELARMHIRNAIVHVLQQPPVQGKVAIDAIVAQVKSPYFPAAPNLVKQALEKQIGRGRPALITGLVDRLIWDMFGGADLLASPSNVAALGAILDLHRAVAEPRVRSQAAKAITNSTGGKLSVACTLVAQIPEAWEGLDEVQRNKFNRWMDTGNTIFVAPLVKICVNRPQLREAALQRIATADLDALGQIVAIGVGAEAVDRAVEMFTEATSRHRANQISTALVMPLIDYVTPDHVRAIIRSPTEKGSDLHYAGGMKLFIVAVRERKILPQKELEDLLREHGFEYLLEAEE
jgi:hypothetical protein